MAQPYQHRFEEPPPTLTPHARFVSDLDYRDTVFIYQVTLEKNAMNESVERWDDVPFSLRASFQEHADNSQHTNPQTNGSRIANVFTRAYRAVKWHDKLCVRGIWMLVTGVLEHFDQATGAFHHTEISADFIDEPGSVNAEKG